MASSSRLHVYPAKGGLAAIFSFFLHYEYNEMLIFMKLGTKIKSIVTLRYNKHVWNFESMIGPSSSIREIIEIFRKF